MALRALRGITVSVAWAGDDYSSEGASVEFPPAPSYNGENLIAAIQAAVPLLASVAQEKWDATQIERALKEVPAGVKDERPQ